MLSIIRSLAITLAISSVVSVVFWSTGSDYIKPFVLTTVGQFAVFWLINTWLRNKHMIESKHLENERIKEFGKQGVEVECSYCKTTNLVPVRFDIDNDFECVNCGKPNAVYVGVTVTQKTTPLNVSPLMINTLNPDEQQAIDKLDTR